MKRFLGAQSLKHLKKFAIFVHNRQSRWSFLTFFSIEINWTTRFHLFVSFVWSDQSWKKQIKLYLQFWLDRCIFRTENDMLGKKRNLIRFWNVYSLFILFHVELTLELKLKRDYIVMMRAKLAYIRKLKSGLVPWLIRKHAWNTSTWLMEVRD